MFGNLRVSFAGALYHITARGNNRGRIFLDEKDFERFKTLLRKYRDRHEFTLYSYALMPNHVHLLIETTAKASISEVMHDLSMSYAKYFNARHHRTGHLWEGRFHSKIVDSELYFLEVMRYMDLNPVRAKLSERPEDYSWTSYRRFGEGKADDLVEGYAVYDNLGASAGDRQESYREYVAAGMGEALALPAEFLNRPVIIGGHDFEARLERLYGEKVWPKYRRLMNRLRELRRAARPE